MFELSAWKPSVCYFQPQALFTLRLICVCNKLAYKQIQTQPVYYSCDRTAWTNGPFVTPCSSCRFCLSYLWFVCFAQWNMCAWFVRIMWLIRQLRWSREILPFAAVEFLQCDNSCENFATGCSSSKRPCRDARTLFVLCVKKWTATERLRSCTDTAPVRQGSSK